MKKIFLILTAIILLIGCKPNEIIKEVEVPIYIDRYNNTTDTFIQHDSIFNTLYVKGDTVHEKEYRYRNVYKTIHDTINNTIEKPVYIKQKEYVPQEVNKIYWYQYILMYTGIFALIYMAIKLIINKFRNK